MTANSGNGPTERSALRGRARRLTGAALAFVLALIGAAGARASDPPHWSSTTMDVDCTSQCHVTHDAQGGNLTQSAANAALCQSCHVAGGLAGALPIDNAKMARPGSDVGVHHAFGVAALHPLFATQVPLDTEMNLRLADGNLVCSTCHDQHQAASGFRGAPRVSAAAKTTVLGGTGMLVSGGTYSGARSSWYLVEIAGVGNAATATFGYSKDNGTSWFPTNCVPGTATTAGCLTAAGSNPVPLDSGVEVLFNAGSFEAGERWEFYGAWPFLRVALDLGDNTTGDAFCRDCHRAWVMDTAAVETWDGSAKSHPLGIAYPSANPAYHPVPLDGNREPQGSIGADSNPTNDLELDDAGNVQCLTCHGVHYADSNTETIDSP